MKFFFTLLLMFLSNIGVNSDNATQSNSFNYSITHDVLHQLMDKYYETRDGQIIANINDYADEVFKKVKQLIIRTGLDPVEMPNQIFKIFPTGTVNLTKGWLEDTSTISRYNDVMVTYRSSMKKITFIVPIKFDSLMIVYKYHTKILLLNTEGDVQGKMTNIKANICLTFDFEKYAAILDSLDITDTGRISLTFSGNNVLDWITSTFINTVSLFLHPVIIRIIQNMVKGGLDKTVEVVNDSIQNLLHK